MSKNTIIIVLLIVIALESALLIKHKIQTMRAWNAAITAQSQASSAPKRPVFLTKGMKLADSPTAKVAYKIYPGELSADAQKAFVNYSMKTSKTADGRTQVDLFPKESDEETQSYKVGKDQSLYFVENTMLDDTENKDNNLRDDYGLVVDQNGIVQ